MTTREALNSAEDRVLLPLLGNDTRKIAAVRDDNGGCSRFVDSCHILSTLYIPLDPCKKKRLILGGMPDEKRVAFQLESECGGFCVARKRASS